MARGLETRLEQLEYLPIQARTLTDQERAVRLHWMLSCGWSPPAWLSKVLGKSASRIESDHGEAP